MTKRLGTAVLSTSRCRFKIWQLSAAVRVLLLAALQGPLAACDNQFPLNQVPAIRPVAAAPTLYEPPVEESYVIAPGDGLQINSYFDPALKQPLVVQPDGRISLLLVGEVMAAGKSPGQLEKQLTKSYASYLDNPDVSVSMTEIVGQAVYVGGEVHAPAVQSARGQITLLQAILGAGGFTNAANREQVLILRVGADGHFTAMQQNVSATLHNQAGEVYLHRHDIVFVPKTQIARADQFIDQYVNQIIPRSVSAVFGYQAITQLGNSSTVLVPQ